MGRESERKGLPEKLLVEKKEAHAVLWEAVWFGYVTEEQARRHCGPSVCDEACRSDRDPVTSIGKTSTEIMAALPNLLRHYIAICSGTEEDES